MKLLDKTIIITGAAHGIGLAISRLFATEGANVIMTDIDATQCGQEARKINDLQKGKCFPLACDVRNTAQIKTITEYALAINGRIDGLVNNVAVAIGGNIMEMEEEAWNTVIDTNLTSVFRCIKTVMPHMVNQKSGSIINMASTQAHRSWNDWTAYAAAKGAIISMTTQLAGQFAPYNIRINSISPGTINTPMLAKRIKTEGESLTQHLVHMHAMQRIGEPAEVAAAALFLAADDSSFITGQDIKVDGGLMVLPRYNEV